MSSLSKNPYLQLGPDSDAAAWAALVAALLISLGLVCFRRRSFAFGPRRWLPVLALCAGLLSHGYAHHYLRGGPRIIDSTYYLLQARTLAAGAFTLPELAVPSAQHGRFMVSPARAPHASGVLFPPGYAAVLALAVALGAPLLLGPVLAASLVLLTYAAARAWHFDERVALTASGLSMISVTLRYHTADTMAHGFAALLVLGGLWALARLERVLAAGASAAHVFAGSMLPGCCAGWLFATRPVTGSVFVVVLLSRALYCWLSCRRSTRPSAAGRSTCVSLGSALAGLGGGLLGALPGVMLLLLQQRAVTGSLWSSAQLAYYRVADGPPGCFRYGFGAGIGCLFEHGDYVRARLPNGYGVWQALATTGRRWLTHSLDIANAAPLALGVPAALWFARREAATGLFLAVVAAVIFAYAPFYFEGSYPGGGARFFVDVLPIEHILLARTLCALPSVAWLWPVTLLGFALHGSAQQRQLRDREGGRPMFEPSLLAEHGVTRGLVFVRTDHGFALGHDPQVRSPKQGVVVVRERGDASDAWLWQALGQPPSYRYLYHPSAASALPSLAALSPSHFAALAATRRFEAEGAWPVLAVEGGFAHPSYVPDSCVSQGRGLLVRPVGGLVRIRVLLPQVREPGLNWSLGLWFPNDPLQTGAPQDPDSLRRTPLPSRPVIRVHRDLDNNGQEISLELEPGIGGCWRGRGSTGRLAAPLRELEISLSQAALIDFFELEPALK